MPAATAIAFGCASTWVADIPAEIGVFALSDATRVTTMPAEMEISSAGICDTRPLPMVRMEYVCTASPHRHAAHHDADHQAADDVDQRDDDAGDGVALDELHGAVHGAVELDLARPGLRGARAPRGSR